MQEIRLDDLFGVVGNPMPINRIIERGTNGSLRSTLNKKGVEKMNW